MRSMCLCIFIYEIYMSICMCGIIIDDDDDDYETNAFVWYIHCVVYYI